MPKKQSSKDLLLDEHHGVDFSFMLNICGFGQGGTLDCLAQQLYVQ